MGPIKCEVLLEKSSNIYFPGEIVKGVVRLNLKNATRISALHLHLVGQARFGENKFEFYHQTKSVELNKILPSGIDKFPIVWNLPHDLISTFNWKSGGVNYYFLTEIKDCISSKNLEKIEEINRGTATTPIEIQNCIDLNELPLEFQRARGYNASYFHPGRNDENSLSVAATVALDFVVDRQCFVPGEFLKFTCSVTYENLNRNRLKKFPGVKVSLDQEDNYFLNGDVKTGTTRIWQKVGPVIKPNETKVWEDSIKIPNCCQSTPMDDYGVISVQYYLNVTASLWSSIEKSQFHIPIVIGMIPLEQQSQNNRPMIQNSNRPSITVVNDNFSEHRLSDDIHHEQIDDYDSCPPDDYDNRPETPPPSYEEALKILAEINHAVNEFSFTCSPPPYCL